MTRAPHGALDDTSGRGAETLIGRYWTAADDAELDVLVDALARDYWEHRKRCRACAPGLCPEQEAWKAHSVECRACQGYAPLTYGLPCGRHAALLEHNKNCPRCRPCPQLQRAIEEVVEWVEARQLLSRAEALRARQRAA